MNKPMQPNSNSEAAIFDAVLACATPQERAAYLDKACAGKPELRQHIEALLAAHNQAAGFLENPQAGAAGATVRLNLPPEERPGERIGRYKLLQKIGEGGCGVVYMAEQEEPVRRRVALKVIKLGMDTEQVVARFEAERQALALMDHQNIAKVLDAGATDRGRPFFVMELVKGIPVTRYADENNLDTRQRLELFIQICQAVQHAHQKGIIHRDLKPSNILVAHDGVPVPKVIDFGIAKATADQRLTDKTLFTALEQFIGTPAYMSPEQAKLSGLDVDTRSDIYSLGVLLYELLTGKTPFEAKRLLEAGLDEIRRIIREEEPPRPSTRLHTLDAAEQTDVAKHRHSEPPKLLGVIRGDLDWIVMKCLEKDRTRRYETANGLAADVRRHLSNEPVVACPPSAAYRFQKLVRRHKLAFAAGGSVAMALVLGLSLASWMYLRARAALKAAEAATRAAEQANERTTLALRQSEAAKAAAEQALKESELAKAATKSAEAATEAAQRREAQALYDSAYAVGQIGGLPAMEANYRESLALFRKVYGQENKDVAKALNALAGVLSLQDKLDEAESSFRELAALYEKLNGRDDVSTGQTLFDLAQVLEKEKKYSEAENNLRQSWAIFKKASGEISKPATDTLATLAGVIAEQGRQDEGAKLARAAADTALKLPGSQLRFAFYPLSKLDDILAAQKKPAEVETVKREVVALARKCTGPESVTTAHFVASLATLLNQEGKFIEAEPLARECLAVGEKLKPDDWTSLNRRCILGGSLLGQMKYDEAEPYLVSGYVGLKQRETDIPAHEKRRLKEALEQLVQLYQAKSDVAQGAEWKQRLAEFNKGIDRVLLTSWLSCTQIVSSGFVNLDFETGEAGETPKGWLAAATEDGFRAVLTTSQPHSGTYCAEIRWPTNQVSSKGEFANLMQSIDAGPYRNKRIEIRAAIRVSTNRPGGCGMMWFRVDRPDGRLGAFDNMHDRPVRSSIWQNYTITADVAHDAQTLNLGLLTLEGATAWWDDVRVTVICDLAQLRAAEQPAGSLSAIEETLKSRKAKLGSEHMDTLASMNALALACERAGRLAEAEPIEQELLASVRKCSDAQSASVGSFLAECAFVRLLEDRFVQAEPFARESLAIRQKLIPDNWLTFHTRSMLGGALLGQRKLAEAEPLLRTGYEGLKAREETIPSIGRILIHESLERLVQLYEAKGDTAQAGQWKQKLTEFEEAETEKKPAVPQP
jgi:hypothetical protein